MILLFFETGIRKYQWVGPDPSSARGDEWHAPIGIPVVHELRGVGKNMQDHYVARVSYPIVGAQTANERSRGLPLAGEVVRWLFTGKGMLTYSPSIVAASALRCWRNWRHQTCNARSLPAASRTARSANSRRRPASAPAPGRCGRCRAAMSRPSRTGLARRRRSTRAICRRKPTGAPSSAGSGWPGGFSQHPRCSRSSGKRAYRACRCRPTTNCSTTRGATVAPAITPAAPA